MGTSIATWGNSSAIRMPKEILQRAGLSRGDIVNLDINERGHIEIVPQNNFREGVRRRRVSFNELFKGYEGGPVTSENPWVSDDFVGAEKKAWLS